jgi:hypothetical protein
MTKYCKLFKTLTKSGMAGIITVSPYTGIRPTELITMSVNQAEREMAGDDDGPVVGLCRLLELIEALTHLHGQDNSFFLVMCEESSEHFPTN